MIAGIRVGDAIEASNEPLSVELGPGLCGQIFDGVQRPLERIMAESNSIYLQRGQSLPALDRKKKWRFTPQKKEDETVKFGDIFGFVEENSLVKIKLMVPKDIPEGLVKYIASAGEFTVSETIATVEVNGKTHDLNMIQKWPVRLSRKYMEKLKPETPLITGQRVLDCMFPCLLGGVTAIPGAFGCGKTSISQAISKYANCDIIVYIGCGERGNEMAEVLMDFPKLKILREGRDVCIMERTVLIANTSNMPVAAREASIYTGISIAEYYRDQGYHVALMADSTSRWAEALREISGRLAEMPAENGYPAYLGARLASFYERAGNVKCVGSPSRSGSITVIGAISPPGGDFSDPVTTSTLSNVQVFWGLDKKLAQKKHFPAINWNISYSRYIKAAEEHFSKIDPEYPSYISTLKQILQRECELLEAVQLVGKASLSETDLMTLEIAQIFRQDFLQQNSSSDYDRHCPIEKTIWMIKVFCLLYLKAEMYVNSENRASWKDLSAKIPETLIRVRRMKYDNTDSFLTSLKTTFGKVEQAFDQLQESNSHLS